MAATPFGARLSFVMWTSVIWATRSAGARPEAHAVERRPGSADVAAAPAIHSRREGLNMACSPFAQHRPWCLPAGDQVPAAAFILARPVLATSFGSSFQ